MFKRVCIIGCGLIGSSIARGIKKNKLATKVVSSNRSNSTNKKVIRFFSLLINSALLIDVHSPKKERSSLNLEHFDSSET